MATSERYNEIKKRLQQQGSSVEQSGSQTKRSDRYNAIKSKLQQGGFSTDVDEAYVNSFLSDARAFVQQEQKDYAGLNYQTATSKDMQASRAATRDDLTIRAGRVRTWLNTNKSKLDSDTYTDLIGQLDGFYDFQTESGNVFRNAGAYYSQWDTEEDYNAFVASQKDYEDKLNLDTDAAEKELVQMERDLQAYQALRFATESQFAPDAKDAQALADLQKKYGDVADLSALITQKRQYIDEAKKTQDFAIQSKEYTALMNAEDFAEMSKYVPQNRTEQRTLDIMMGNYSNEASGWDDPLYEYVNGNQDAGAYLSNQAAENYGGEGLAAIFGRMSDSKTESQQMTKDEVAIFNYLYATQGKEAAHAYYYDHLQSELNARQRAYDTQYWAGYAEEDPFGSSVFSIATSPLKGLSYVGQAADYLTSGTVDQNAGYNSFSYTNSAIRSRVSQQIENSGKWGKVGSFLYQTGMSMGDFVMSTAVSGGNQTFALAIMGSGAAADTTISAKDRGLSDNQSFWLGTVAGAAEILMEKIGLDALFDADLLKDSALKYVLKNALSEGGEEIGTDLINTLADVLIARDKSEWQTAIDGYMAEGKSESEAFGLALADKALELGLSGLGGALSGGVLGGMGAVTNTAQNNAQTRKSYGNSQQELVAEALEIDPENAFAKKMQVKLDGGKNLSGSQLNKLVQQNETAIKAQGTSVETAQTDTKAAVETARMETPSSQQTSRKTESVTTGNTFTTSEKAASEGSYGTSEDGKTYFKGEAVNVMGVASIKDGNMTLKLEDGRTVDAKDVEYGSADEAVVYETVASLGIHALGANMLIENYNPGGKIAATVYAKGIEEAYKLGQMNVPLTEVAAMPFASQLAAYQRQAAYRLGELFGGKQTAKEQATARKNRNAEGTDTSKGRVHFDGDRNSLNKTQKASMDAIEVLAKTLGVQIYVFESEVGSDGKRKGDNGWYDPSDGSIHIDLYAGSDGKGTMLFTVAHELTHFIRQWSPAKFKVLTNFLMKQYGQQGVSVNELVQSQMDKAKRSGRELDYDAAYEEMVADSMESMLSDGSIIEMMAELKQQDQSLWQKICDWFKDLAGKLQAVVDAYKGVEPDSAEGRMVADMKDMIGTLQALYMDALVDASENFDAGVQKNTTEDSGGVKYQAKRLSEDSLEAYLRAGSRQNKNKVRALESGKQIILTSEQEITDFISNAIDKKSDEVTVAYGMVNDRLASEVSKQSKGKITIDDYYLELVPTDLQHAYEEHSLAKEEGDIALTRSDFEKIPEYLDSFTEVLYAIKYSSGHVRVCVSKKLPNGRILIIETVSKSRGSIQFKNAIGVSEEKYINKYLPEYKKRAGMNTGGSESSNISPRDNSNSNISVLNDDENVNKKFSDRDAAYMDAVKRGDAAAAQRMVDEAAKAAGYTIKAYHGTTNQEAHSTWNAARREWDTTYTPITVFKKQYDEQAGHFFSSDEDNAGGYGSYLYSVYLMMKNPLVIDCNGQSYSNISHNGMEMDTYEWAEYAKKHRYDGVIFQNVRDGVDYGAMSAPTTDYVVFESSRIKSADPITYDNEGNVIPISERFKVTKGDFDDTFSNDVYKHFGMTRKVSDFSKNLKFSGRDVNWTDSNVQQMEQELSDVTAKRQAAEDRYNALLNDADLADAERRLSDMRSNGESRLAVVRSPEYKAVRAERDAIKERLGVDAARDAVFDLRERERKLQAEIRAAEESAKVEAGRKVELEAVKQSGMSEADYFRARAAKRFGYTQEFKYAGYLLTDGRMLDFTSTEGKKDGKRDKDHREIADIYEYTQQSAALLRFLNDGNIRIMAETPGIDLSANHEPTKQQYAEIKQFVREYTGKRQFMVDISAADGQIVGTYTYDGRVSADRVISDIQYYFQHGKLREQSSVAQFHYSQRDVGRQEAVTQALEKENAKLREDVTELRELVSLQRQVTNGTKFTKTSVDAAARSLKEYANAKGDTKELTKLLDGLYEYIAAGKELTWEGVKEQAQPVVDWLQSHVDVKSKRSEYAQDILNQLHGSRVYLDESQMAEAAYRFGSYDAFRKGLMGNITLAKNAETSLDSLWAEFSEMYPDVFDSEISAADMPSALADIIHRLRNSDTTALEYARNREMIAQDLLQQVYDSYWRVSTLYTVADVKQRQINRLKGEHFQRMNKLKEQHRENVAQLKQAHKERLEQVRQDYRNRMDTKIQKITEQYQESRKKGVEGRRKTEMRHKIQKAVKKLNDLLLNETKERHVPENLKKAVAEALDAVNMDTVGADERIAKYDALIAKATDPDVIASLTETRDRIAKAGERLSDRIGKLKAAYDSIRTGADSASISVYDEVIANKIQEVVELVGNTALRDMSYEQLEAVYEMYTMVAKSISNANKSFKEARGATITQMGAASIREIKNAGGSNQYALKALENAKKFGWDLLKPYYAFSLIGSDTLSRLYDNVRKGEDTWAVDVSQARTFFRQQAEQHGYDDWDMSEEYTFQDVSGREFKVSLSQIMSLYAYSKRAQADKHLEKGGFVFDSAVEVVQKKHGVPMKYRVNTANAYNLNRAQINEIVGTLSEEQAAFVDAMQDYLSTVMGEKGNEVSMALYDVRLFKEKNYFPLKSASQYTFQQSENAGEVKLKNSGFSKKTVANASNPIILSDFMDVWGNHVNDMSMYHAFVLPLEDFNRVYNYKSIASEETSSQSVKASLQNAYGVASTKYIKQMLEDINGGARTDDRASILSRWMGKFKKGSVFANASVVIQQPSAIARAAALIDLQYFIGPKISQKRHKQLWEEVKQYAPVAIIKEMGYFDTNMGRSTVEYLTAKEYETIGDKAKAMFTDGNYRDEVLSRPAALADELSWCYIWEAVKRETRGNNPGMDVRSEQFLKKAGDRFTEVVTRTQVYDSVLSRSGLMRSKDTGAKMMTAFMSEPTTNMNMVFDALVQGKRGNRWYTRNAIGAVVASQVLNSLLVSIVYAARDDDEDKSYWEKYLANFVAKTLDSLNPLTYLPFIKDIVSITRGYTVERSDMSVISDIWAAWQKLPNENVSLYRKIEDFGGSVAQAFGLPVKNIMRDVRALLQTTQSFLNGPETTAMGIGVAIQEEVTGDDIPKYRQLYDAMAKGDTEQQARIAASYADESALESAIRKGLREFDARISEAAEARYYGDFEEYERIFGEIEQEGHFTHSQIAGAVQAEINDMDETDSSGSIPKKYGMYDIDDFMLAVYTDDTAMAESIRDEMQRTAQENGKSEEQAQKSFVSSAVSACKDQYLSGKISEDQAMRVLTKYCDRSESKAQADLTYWDYKQENPDMDVSAQWFDTYYGKIESSGISIDIYVQYCSQKSAYSKKADIMEIIDDLPIRRKQKDALYYAEGWAESTLDEAPWH